MVSQIHSNAAGKSSAHAVITHLSSGVNEYTFAETLGGATIFL